MVWVAFGAGIILGLFGGMLVLGLIRGMAASRSGACVKKPPAAEGPEVSAPLNTQATSQA